MNDKERGKKTALCTGETFFHFFFPYSICTAIDSWKCLLHVGKCFVAPRPNRRLCIVKCQKYMGINGEVIQRYNWLFPSICLSAISLAVNHYLLPVFDICTCTITSQSHMTQPWQTAKVWQRFKNPAHAWQHRTVYLLPLICRENTKGLQLILRGEACPSPKLPPNLPQSSTNCVTSADNETGENIDSSSLVAICYLSTCRTCISACFWLQIYIISTK